MEQPDFVPHAEIHTIVYNKDGKEIERLEGRAEIKPKDYEDRLPITYHHVKVTTEILNVVKIEK